MPIDLLTKWGITQAKEAGSMVKPLGSISKHTLLYFWAQSLKTTIKLWHPKRGIGVTGGAGSLHCHRPQPKQPECSKVRRRPSGCNVRNRKRQDSPRREAQPDLALQNTTARVPGNEKSDRSHLEKAHMGVCRKK